MREHVVRFQWEKLRSNRRRAAVQALPSARNKSMTPGPTRRVESARTELTPQTE